MSAALAFPALPDGDVLVTRYVCGERLVLERCSVCDDGARLDCSRPGCPNPESVQLLEELRDTSYRPTGWEELLED